MKVEGLAAVVTGAGSGMGAATSRALAAAGAKVALLDLNRDAAEAVAREIGGLAVACDVGDGESVAAALEQARAAHGTARIAVACAGIAPGARLVGRDGPHDPALFERVIRVNLLGTFHLLRLTAAAMAAEDPLPEAASASGERGLFVATASVAAYEGQVGQVAYSASKGGVVGLTLPAARELAKSGIRVMTVAPGLIGTPMIEAMPSQVQDSLIATTLFPQRLGRPEEFAQLVLHIAANEMLNGSVIRLDGAVRLAPR
ncbi:SDR family NAD(P)-dependent oxidoreductase [Inquilinus limosus]|uniref:SDR family NAD(P)-dependent oxidoreductase n=1 Tax=Inquilinus limosus TaxID=171674 RepID=UPI0004244783|nr:SDR family NAD(P)-dependent oxidoreductase [Inquilinus limosus]